MKELTITELASRANALEVCANAKGLTVYFDLNDYRVTGTVFERRSYTDLEKVFHTDLLDDYDPNKRNPEQMNEMVDTVLHEMAVFVQNWRGHDIERISKEISELETKLAGKRDELAEAQQKKEAEEAK